MSATTTLRFVASAYCLAVLAAAHAASPLPAAKASPKAHQAAFAPPPGGGGPGATAPSPPPGLGSLHETDEAETLVFSAPPRETPEEGARLYRPVAEYLTRVTGRKIVYRHPQDWLSYQTEMLKGGYDIVFDGPHFNSWRASHLQHTPLARLQEEHVFAVIVRRQEQEITELRQLAGKKVCALSPPNLGTLAILSEFDNPLRQPAILNSLGWRQVYEGVVMDRRCVAGVLPVANLKKYDGGRQFTRVLFKTRALPNQAFSAGPRVPAELRALIAAALVSEEGKEATAALRAAYGAEQGLVVARKEEYAGLEHYLKDIWAFTR